MGSLLEKRRNDLVEFQHVCLFILLLTNFFFFLQEIKDEFNVLMDSLRHIYLDRR